MSDAVIGTEVDGYRIQSVLGRGGMGTVYKAEDVNLSRTVAIKRINPGQQERESFIHRFRSEAQALARIDSPQIVSVYALRETDIGLLIVMEYVEGGTLKDPIEQKGALPAHQAVPILDQTLTAFHDAHSAGVIHRDIKPENVMLTQDGKVKVTDFGIAKLRQPDSGETVTQGGQGGTLKYMSPEQISSIDDVDARSDVYSLGMTAYKMLVGELPFEETDTDFDIMRKVVEGKIPPPDEVNPDVPSGLARWIIGAIQKEQEDRYQSAEEMRDALHEAEQQSEQTVTQADWEVGGDDADVDETQTVVPGSEDQTQTVVPGEDEEDGIPDPGGETVMDPAPTGATQPAVPDPEDAKEEVREEEQVPAAAKEESPIPDEAKEEAPAAAESEETGTNWAVVGGGVVGVLLLLVGGYVAFTQLGGGSGAAATLSLQTAPEGALVLVNGDTAGTTPLDGYALKEAGPVMLEVRKDGHSPLDTTLEATSGERLALQDVTLAEANSGAPDGNAPSASDGTTSNTTLAENTQEPSPDRSPATAESEPTEPAPADNQTTSAQADGEEPTESPTRDDPARAETESPSEEGGATGLVEVTPEPSATVFIDGEEQPAGRAVTLMEGEHTVKCRHRKHGSIEKTVAVAAGETQTLSCYFVREVRVNAVGGPYGRIWRNRSNTGKNTPSTLSLPPGTHRIEVRRNTLDNYTVNGGLVKTEREGESQVDKFFGTLLSDHGRADVYEDHPRNFL